VEFGESAYGRLPFSMRFSRCLALFLGMSGLSALALPPNTPPNIVLITLDTTRADRMGFLGSHRALTPNLDRLAKDGIIFSRAYAQVPLTTASHAVILTGTYPQFNHVNDFGKPLLPDVPYLPDILHRRGYRTAAFVGSLILDPLDGLAPGFDRGFDVYDAGFRLRRPREDRYKTVERRGGDVVARALAWLRKPRKGPFFLWVHLYDAHDPYDPPAPYKQQHASFPYDGEIAYEDSVVGTLLNALRAGKLYDGALIAVMADHGEAFGEHGERTHGIFLYDETIHVPLVLKQPSNHFAGKTVTSRTGLVDVAPTILQIAGVPLPKNIQGESVLRLMTRGRPSGASKSTRASAHMPQPETDLNRPAYAETDYPHRAFGWSSLRSLRSDTYLFIQAPQRELYDQSADPQASRNLASTRPATADTLAAQLTDFRVRSSSSSTRPAEIDPQQAEKLNALGYVASDTGTPEAESLEKTGSNVVDPKNKVEIANLMHEAIMDMEDGRYHEVIPRLERVLTDEPKMPVAQMQLGTAYARLKDYQKAVPALKRALLLRPDSGMGHYELGLALFGTGDWQAAAPEFEFAVQHAPKWADAHFSLGSVYARIDRVPDAMRELHTALELAPSHYRANLLLGRILSLQGKPRDALPNLREAAKVESNSREAHAFLADAYEQLGLNADAQRERAQAQRLPPPGQQ